MSDKYAEARKAIETVLGCSIEKLPVHEQPKAYADMRALVAAESTKMYQARIAELETQLETALEQGGQLFMRIAELEAENTRLRELLKVVTKAAEPAVELMRKDVADWDWAGGPEKNLRLAQRQRDELIMALYDAREYLNPPASQPTDFTSESMIQPQEKP
jgi:hypothetical protein